MCVKVIEKWKGPKSIVVYKVFDKNKDRTYSPVIFKYGCSFKVGKQYQSNLPGFHCFITRSKAKLYAAGTCYVIKKVRITSILGKGHHSTMSDQEPDSVLALKMTILKDKV